jgi:hypothetical protein
VALLARAAAAPKTSSDGQVLSPTVCKQNCTCMLVWLMPVVVDRMTRTASLSASHSSPGLPPHHRKRARCCLRLLCRALCVCRNCTCMLVWLMPLMVDRIMRTASLSAWHSSPGLPPHRRPRQRARCCLRLFCSTLSVVCRNCICMIVW